eukprot:jgi/Ulvmu1/3894/UM018_0115.1
MQTEGGFTDLGIIGEKAPIAPDVEQTKQYRTPHTAAPTLTRTSLAGTTLSRVSAVHSNGTTSPTASVGRNTLVRVSAANYPKLSRASQAGIARNSVVGSSGGLNRSSVVRGAQEVARRPTALESLGVTMEIKDSTTGKLVMFKNDGERFSVSKHTIKFIQNHTYQFSLVVEDSVPLEDGMLMLTFLNADSAIIKEPVECERHDKAYVGSWTCTCAPSAKGARTTIEAAMKFEDFPQATLPLNAKIYPPSKSRDTTGTNLKSIVMNFARDGTSSKVKYQQWLSN